MKPGLSTILLPVMASFVVAGCASPSKSFLSASAPNVVYSDLERSARPLRLNLVVEFQRNGQHFPRGDVPLRDYSAQILENTRLISPVDAVSAVKDQGEEGTVKVVLNNIAGSGTAAAETTHAGLPLWILGKTITESYLMSMFITAKGRTIGRTGIKQAFHTAIGNEGIPEGAEAFPTGEAFGRMLEQMILRTLLDMQRTSDLL